MYAKQYEITLPADYDMTIIRKRVADHGHLLADRAGLGLKAFFIRERGIGGSPVNQCVRPGPGRLPEGRTW